MTESVGMAIRPDRSVESEHPVQYISSRESTSESASEHGTSTEQPSYEGDVDLPTPSEQPTDSFTLQHMPDDVEAVNGSKAGSVKAVEKTDKKRAAEEQSEGSASKKAKVGEENDQAKEPRPEDKPDHEETVDEIKEKANRKITFQMERNKKLTEKNKELGADLKAAEDKRDELHTENILLKDEIESLSAKLKERATKDKSRMNTMCADLKARLTEDFDEKLEVKTGRIEKKWKGKMNTAQTNVNEVLEKKDEKIEDLTEKLKESKASHAKDNKEKNAAIVEAKKEGGPKAKEDLKNMRLEMKYKDDEIKEIKSDHLEVLKRIKFLESEVNAAKTLEKQADKARDNTFEDNRKLQSEIRKLHNELASWKAKAVEARQDGPIREQQLQAEIKRVKGHYQREIDQLQQRAIAGDTWRRSCIALRHANDKNNEEQRAALQKKLHDISIEKAKMGELEQSELQNESEKLKEAIKKGNETTHAALKRDLGKFPFVQKPKEQAAGAKPTVPHGLPNVERNGAAAASKARGWGFPDEV